MAGSLRAKFQVFSVRKLVGAEELELHAVYGKDGSDNASWSKFTPAGKLTMTITNEDAWGVFMAGAEVFIDITAAE